MKQVLASLSLISFCLISAQGFCADSKSNTQLKDKTDKISYSIGMDVGKSIDKQGIQINPEAFVQGLKDAKGKNSLMTEDEMRQILLSLQTEIMERQKKLARELAEKNLAAGEKFLADNKKKQDIKTLPSGLQYKIIKEGNGPTPKATDTVTTHYQGKLIDGTEFDSSYKRGEPAKFTVNGVIPGWTEALQLMKTGSKWEIYVPAKLAYGEHGIGQVIGPNSTLIFDLELLSIEKPEAQAQNKAATQSAANASKTEKK